MTNQIDRMSQKVTSHFILFQKEIQAIRDLTKAHDENSTLTIYDGVLLNISLAIRYEPQSVYH